MGLIQGIQRFIYGLRFGKDGKVALNDCACIDICQEIYVRELALWVCTSIIAKAINKCEFKTYLEGEEVKQRVYYQWNLEPNRNQSKSEFITELIGKMVRTGEGLVIEHKSALGPEMLIANDYEKRESSTTYDTFRGIVTRGDKEWHNTFLSKDVLLFKYSNQNIERLMRGTTELYSKLFSTGLYGYEKGNGEKLIMNYDSIPPPGSDAEKAFNNLINTQLKTFMNSSKAALPVGKGYSIEEFGKSAKGSSSSTSRDIKSMIDDIFELYFRAFGIPLQFLTSTVEGVDGAYKQLMTEVVVPFVKILKEEINRKQYGYDAFSVGSGLEIDTDSVIFHDAFEVAISVDKLISSGVQTINEIRVRLGEKPIDEPFANTRWITKNYERADEAMNRADSG